MEGASLPLVGTDVILRCGAIDVFGTVVWATDERCGVHFDEPVSPRELVALRQLAVASERYHMTPEELQAAADWLNGVAR